MSEPKFESEEWRLPGKNPAPPPTSRYAAPLSGRPRRLPDAVDYERALLDAFDARQEPEAVEN